ncbi:MAG TPA: hypothetical protein VI819_02680 [Patescibacteria group bacterium]|nr:hypothetical protein [Patescibacteria group bacterium]
MSCEEKISVSRFDSQNPFDWDRNQRGISNYTEVLYHQSGQELSLTEAEILKDRTVIMPVQTFFSSHPKYGPDTQMGKILFLSVCSYMIENRKYHGKLRKKKDNNIDLIKKLYLKARTEKVIKAVGAEIGLSDKKALLLAEELRVVMFQHLSEKPKNGLRFNQVPTPERTKNILKVIEKYLPQETGTC